LNKTGDYSIFPNMPGRQIKLSVTSPVHSFMKPHQQGTIHTYH